MPPAMKSVPYSPVKDIEFVGKKRKNSEVSISIPAAIREIFLHPPAQNFHNFLIVYPVCTLLCNS